MRLAVVADIHANVRALEAVLADMAGRRIDRIVNLGDCVSGPLWPAETIAVLRQHDWPTVRGNHDRQAGAETGAGLGGSDGFAWDRLTDTDRDWLRSQPTLLRLSDGIVAMHARPDHDEAYLLEDQQGETLQRASATTVASRLGSLDARIVLTAHSHLAGSLLLPDGRWVINPGSVGCPGYYDDSTVPHHVSEAGSPAARYAVIEVESGRDAAPRAPVIEFISLPYGHDEAADRASASGHADWPHVLRTGFVPRSAR